MWFVSMDLVGQPIRDRFVLPLLDIRAPLLLSNLRPPDLVRSWWLLPAYIGSRIGPLGQWSKLSCHGRRTKQLLLRCHFSIMLFIYLKWTLLIKGFPVYLSPWSSPD
ncbi:hypothetical protein NC652_036600 [Populus alba x Populus x berolinensis]|nr:hypothetical protein NC652_036600 [Populus alba x Populus x berolinensis]